MVPPLSLPCVLTSTMSPGFGLPILIFPSTRMHFLMQLFFVTLHHTYWGSSSLSRAGSKWFTLVVAVGFISVSLNSSGFDDTNTIALEAAMTSSFHLRLPPHLLPRRDLPLLPPDLQGSRLGEPTVSTPLSGRTLNAGFCFLKEFRSCLRQENRSSGNAMLGIRWSWSRDLAPSTSSWKLQLHTVECKTFELKSI